MSRVKVNLNLTPEGGVSYYLIDKVDNSCFSEGFFSKEEEPIHGIINLLKILEVEYEINE
jgi:hypothetical protein